MREHDDFVIASLLEEGAIEKGESAAAQKWAGEKHCTPLEALVQRGTVSARAVALVRAGICEVPYVDLANHIFDLRNTTRLSRGLAESACALPLFILDGVATIGMADPMDLRALDQLRAALGSEVEPVLCEGAALRNLIERAYAMAGNPTEANTPEPAAEATSLTTGREPAVAAVNQIITHAVERGASDIHIGPDEGRLILRLRIDGVLHALQGPPLSLHSGIVQRLKVMANLDLTQTRRPQDGKIRFAMGTGGPKRNVDIRLSMIPTVCGENVVMRLLSSAATLKTFAELGMQPTLVESMGEILNAPNGMMLVTGPTGSGKTTTLYAGLMQLNTPERNVVTIEDPVEIRVPMLRQVQTNSEIGLTFAGALRSILRQDPDVVLVGEIRDEETAKIAMQAALTGHLVLSSLHTNDAPGAIPRLLEFGCPAFAISGSLLGVIAQRLVRRVCAECTKSAPATPAQQRRFKIGPHETFGQALGCARCGSSGFRGRVGVYELLRMTPAVQSALDGGDAGRIRRAASESGMAPMWRDGLDKARLGWTTLEEVARMAAITDIENTVTTPEIAAAPAPAPPEAPSVRIAA
ncbi:GspE/PulE family protein [soil metagenome]